MIAGLPLVFLLLAQQLCQTLVGRAGVRFEEAACTLLWCPYTVFPAFGNGVRKEF